MIALDFLSARPPYLPFIFSHLKCVELQDQCFNFELIAFILLFQLPHDLISERIQLLKF